MIRIARSIAVLGVVVVMVVGPSLFASGGTGGGGGFAGVSLAISKENAPAGGIAQLKVTITEPKPISTGGGSLTFDAFADILGIAVFSPAQDTSGVAVVHGSNMNLSIVSSSASFGTTLDYPILTIAGRVPQGTLVGTNFPLTIDPGSLQLFDTTGAVYPTEVKQGHLICGTGVAIGDVSPGSAALPAGAVVTITGSNFVSNTKINFAEAKIAQTHFVSSTRIDVVLGSSASMHGMMIQAKNPDGSQSTYFSYQRTRPASFSADAVMQSAVPLMPPVARLSSTVPLPTPAPSTTYGIAIQNISSLDATAFVELLDAGGNTIASQTVAVPSSRYVLQEQSELFGTLAVPGAAIRVTGDQPVEVLGIAADQVAGTASPILAQ